MCLIVKENIETYDEVEKIFNSPLIAEENILVYKVLNHLRYQGFTCFAKSPYQGFRYTKGKKYSSELRMDYDRSHTKDNKTIYSLYIESGLHAWQSRNDQCESLLKMESNQEGFVTQMIIPKGSKYFIGLRGDIVSDQLIWPSKFYYIKEKIKQIFKYQYKSL